MPTVKMVEYEDANPEVRAVYDLLLNTKFAGPNFVIRYKREAL